VPLWRAKEEISISRKAGQIIARHDPRQLILVYLGASLAARDAKIRPVFIAPSLNLIDVEAGGAETTPSPAGIT